MHIKRGPMPTKEEQWNVLLKLKSLPFGSVHCVKNDDLEAEVISIISKVTNEGCLNDVDIHDKFCNRYFKW